MTNEWLQRLNYGGLNPKNSNKLTRFISYFYILFNTVMVFLMVLDSVFAEFESIGHFAEGLIITLGYFQVLIKISIPLY